MTKFNVTDELWTRVICERPDISFLKLDTEWLANTFSESSNIDLEINELLDSIDWDNKPIVEFYEIYQLLSHRDFRLFFEDVPIIEFEHHGKCDMIGVHRLSMIRNHSCFSDPFVCSAAIGENTVMLSISWAGGQGMVSFVWTIDDLDAKPIELDDIAGICDYAKGNYFVVNQLSGRMCFLNLILLTVIPEQNLNIINNIVIFKHNDRNRAPIINKMQYQVDSFFVPGEYQGTPMVKIDEDSIITGTIPNFKIPFADIPDLILNSE